MSDREVVEVLKAGIALIEPTRWGYPVPETEGKAWITQARQVLESLEPRVQRRTQQREAAGRGRARPASRRAPRP
jgi:hypothetical protein